MPGHTRAGAFRRQSQAPKKNGYVGQIENITAQGTGSFWKLNIIIDPSAPESLPQIAHPAAQNQAYSNRGLPAAVPEQRQKRGGCQRQHLRRNRQAESSSRIPNGGRLDSASEELSFPAAGTVQIPAGGCTTAENAQRGECSQHDGFPFSSTAFSMAVRSAAALRDRKSVV